MPSSKHEDVLVVSLASEKRKKIAQALSNETTVKILQELTQQASSATELADRLNLPLTTVKYSIDALLDAELIRVISISLSQKRREMKNYIAIKRAIIFAPEKTSSEAIRLLERILPYFVVVLLSIPLALMLRALVWHFVSEIHEITLTPAGAAFYSFIAGCLFAVVSLFLIKAIMGTRSKDNLRN